MKLDAGTETVFRRYDRPLTPVTLDQIVVGLCQLSDVTMQALFAGGPSGNADPDFVRPLANDSLEAIAHALRAAGCKATVFGTGLMSDRDRLA
jgi:hypothetical protein